jgi:hypothetical protein
VNVIQLRRPEFGVYFFYDDGANVVRQWVSTIPCPIFRLGPFDEETEITFLAGARWDEKKNGVRPFSAIGEAEENLELLVEDRTRRRRG